MRQSCLFILLPLMAACASAGGVPAGPVAWPPGAYYLEATVSYSDGSGTVRDLYSADLYIEPDQSMRLDSHVGVCRDSTPPERRRDAERRIRTFPCGAVSYVLRPGSGTVTGDVVATVREGRRVEQCLRRGVNGTCLQSHMTVVTALVRKEARLRVRERE
ncbi:MAG: hypothetical protein OEN00_06780 [Gemmatimonadota bacterium]|nr:hypothetical protein [Gemmatimonadota bacterium]